VPKRYYKIIRTESPGKYKQYWHVETASFTDIKYATKFDSKETAENILNRMKNTYCQDSVQKAIII